MSIKIKLVGLSILTPLLCLGVSFAEDYESMYNALLQEYNALSGDFVSCINTLNTKIGQVSSLSGSLNTCQTNLNKCTNSCDVMVSSCQENLSGCQSNLSSLENYNNSLTNQLQQCLADLPVPCEGTGCDEVATGINAIFSFFWEKDDQMYSLPIANNIFLPRGYKAYVESGVVAIASEEKQKIRIEEGQEVINGAFFSFIIGVVILCFSALFCYYVKKFLSKFFIPKEKI